MANVNLYENHLEDIAEAIRVRTSQTDTYTPGEMVTAVGSIYSAQSGNTEALEDALIQKTATDIEVGGIGTIWFNFIDFPFLQSISFPDVTYYGWIWSEEENDYTYAWANICNCPVLTSINFPNLANDFDFENQPVKFGRNPMIAIYNCSSLRSISFPKLKAGLGMHNLPELETVDFGDLEYFILSGVGIGTEANFYNCPKLKAIILRGPKIVHFWGYSFVDDYWRWSSIFQNSDFYFYVPERLITDYKSEYPLLKFRAIELYPDICGEVSQ